MPNCPQACSTHILLYLSPIAQAKSLVLYFAPLFLSHSTSHLSRNQWTLPSYCIRNLTTTHHFYSPCPDLSHYYLLPWYCNSFLAVSLLPALFSWSLFPEQQPGWSWLILLKYKLDHITPLLKLVMARISLRVKSKSLNQLTRPYLILPPVTLRSSPFLSPLRALL